MAEYDVRCINCYHKSHEDKLECPYCPMPTKENPNSRCREFVRADVFIARSMARMEQQHQQTHGQLMMALSAIFDLFQEAYPQASEALKTKLEARQKAAEAEMELQRTKALADADEALKAANAAEERRAMAEVAEGYQKRDNVIPFPVKEEETIA
jgi:ribosome-binding ATPase YchF (GTP1/OBG family)